MRFISEVFNGMLILAMCVNFKMKFQKWLGSDSYCRVISVSLISLNEINMSSAIPKRVRAYADSDGPSPSTHLRSLIENKTLDETLRMRRLIWICTCLKALFSLDVAHFVLIWSSPRPLLRSKSSGRNIGDFLLINSCPTEPEYTLSLQTV